MGSFSKLQNRIQYTIEELKSINKALDNMRQIFKDSPREEIDDIKRRIRNIEEGYF